MRFKGYTVRRSVQEQHTVKGTPIQKAARRPKWEKWKLFKSNDLVVTTSTGGSVMKVSIERKRPTLKKLFGGAKETDYESAFVTIQFSTEEIETIKRNRLEDRLVYEHPSDESDYEKGQATARAHPNSYAGKNPPPRYKQSRFVSHFLKEAIQEVYARLDTPMRFAEIQKTVEDNLRELKKLMEAIQSFPTDKKDFNL